jgi:glucan 1,3-beta-glucosidase
MPVLPVLALALLGATAAAAAPAGCAANSSWWLESTTHGAGFKNVKDFGAKGDGLTDDTAAILAALTTGRQPVFSTATPTAVYFPAGTYIVSASLPIYFYTFISGSPCGDSIVQLAEGKAFAGYIFDGDSGQGEWGDDDDSFYRGISHLTIRTAAGNPGATGLHWAQSQAGMIRNVTIDLTAGGKAGFFGENGSGGFIDGLTILGELRGEPLGAPTCINSARDPTEAHPPANQLAHARTPHTFHRRHHSL